MNFVFSDEQLQLRETVQQFLAANAPTSQIRTLMETDHGFDRSIWRSLIQELGLGGIHVPDVHGGAGLSYVELCIVFEEMGRALFMGPFLSNTLATNAIALFGTEQQKQRFLPPILTGERIVTVATAEQDGGWLPSGPSTRMDNLEFLNGEKRFVTDALIADTFIVLAKDAKDQIAFFLVDRERAGVDVVPQTGLDPTRKIGTVSFTDAACERLGNCDATKLSRFFDLAITALSNEMVGGAQQMLDSALEYSRTRVQFGRSIASLQAIKHKCADLVTQLELAKSSAYVAAEAADSEDGNRFSALASAAKASANDAYMQAASDCIQIHGGIGFTWENDTHLWYKRAKSSEVFLGGANHHRERFLRHWVT